MGKFRGAVLSCGECGRSFKVPPSRAKSARYCSKKCADKNRSDMHPKNRVALICPNCKKTFEVPASHKGRRKYCSSPCKHGHADYLSALSTRTTGGWKGGLVAHTDGYVYER